MRLQSIEARDFLSYPTLELDVSDIPHAAIVGRNGAGKSAILDAILWCLFAQGRGSSDELIRDGALDTYVRTTWARSRAGEAEVIVVTRSRSKTSDESSLTVTVNGEDRSATKIPDTQRRIDRLVGMRYKAMVAGPVMVQGQSGALLQAKPAEATDLLVELFQLELWAEYHEAAKARKDELTARLKDARADHADTEQAIAGSDVLSWRREIKQHEAELAEGEAFLIQTSSELQEVRTQAAVLQDRARRAAALGTEITNLADQLARAQERRALTERKVEAARKAITEAQPVEVPAPPDEAPIRSLQDKVNAMVPTVADMRAQRARIPDLERRMTDALEAAKAQSPCEGDPPGCRYSILASERRDEAEVLSNQVDQITAQTRTLGALEAELVLHHDGLDKMRVNLTNQRDAYVAKVAERERAEAALAQARDTLAEYVPALDRMAEEITTINELHAAKVKERMELDQDEFAMSSLADKINELTETITTARARQDELTRLVATTKQLIDHVAVEEAHLAELVTEITALARDEKVYATLVKAFHRTGIPSMILEQALPEIELRANEILSKLPDDYSIRIDTKVATKSQTFKDEIRVTVMRAGRERAYHMLSGGQRFRVEFAVRIALAAVIAARVDATVDTLWLDEPLGPLDREGQEAVSDTLNAVRDDFGFIGVVSHVADFNDRFEHRISVTMEDDESVAVVQ